MTFCGDLPFVPSGINHHPFENLRRKGHHCHDRKRLSGGRPQKFLPAFGQKLLWDVHFTPGLAETVVAVFAPGDRGLNGCRAPDTTTGRHPPQRRRARARNGVAPHIPAAFCRDAGSAGHGATEAARPERSLQARGFASGMEARQGGDSFAGSVHDSPPRQGDARKRHRQENNKTDSNQGSSNQSQNRRKKRIITGKVMSFLTTGHKQRRRGKRTGAAGARSSPFPEGNGLPGSLVVHARIMPARRKGPPANQQPLYKGASVQSDQHQP